MTTEFEDVNLGVRRIVRKGGSLSLTLTKEVLDALKLEEGDDVAFIQEGRSKRVFLMKQQDLVATTMNLEKSLKHAATLMGRPLSPQEIQKILKNLDDQTSQ